MFSLAGICINLVAAHVIPGKAGIRRGLGMETNALIEASDLYLEIVVEPRDRKGVTDRNRLGPRGRS